jgi:hypothetical protein
MELGTAPWRLDSLHRVKTRETRCHSDGGMAQVAECLLSKHKAWSPNLTTEKNTSHIKGFLSVMPISTKGWF